MVEAIPELRTPRLLLRAWVEADAEAMHTAFGDAETMRFWSFPARRDVAETAAMIRESRSVDPMIHAAFAITLGDTGEPIGMVNYHEHRPVHRRLAVGWILVRSWQRQGIMREAVPAMLNHCFDRLNVHRIEARIEAENAPSVALADWLGFQREGLMRDWMFVAGQPRSPHLHALLRPDWAAGGGRGLF
jgi:[ribosomal protein S5]-alanine N-acetyltransferase